MRQLLTRAAIVATAIISIALIGCTSETTETTDTGATESKGVDGRVSSEIANLAHRLVIAYMSDKTWGFFGATCEQWIEQDYRWDPSLGELQIDGRTKLTYTRNPDRMLGPEQLVFFVDIDTGEVEGDNESETGRSGVAEGCDKW